MNITRSRRRNFQPARQRVLEVIRIPLDKPGVRHGVGPALPRAHQVAAAAVGEHDPGAFLREFVDEPGRVPARIL